MKQRTDNKSLVDIMRDYTIYKYLEVQLQMEQQTYQDPEKEKQEAKGRLQSVLGDIQKLIGKAQSEGNTELAQALIKLTTIKL